MRKLIFTIVLLLSLVVFAANEIRFAYDSTNDPNLYVIIGSTTDANVWDSNNSAWASWVNANEPNYALVMSKVRKDFYDAQFPAGITTGGIYPLTIYKRADSEPNITDDLIVGAGEIVWTGSVEITDYVLWQDTNENQTDQADGGRLDLIWDATLTDTAAWDTTSEARTFLTGSDTTVATQAKQDTIIADSNRLDTDWANGGRLDLIIDVIKARTDTLWVDWINGGRLDIIIDSILADSNEVETDWTNGGRLDTIIDSILTDTGTTLDDFLDTEIAAILADSNELQTDWVDGGRLDLLIDAILADSNDIQGEWATIVAQIADVNTDTDTLIVDVNDVETTVEALPTVPSAPVGQ